MLTEKLANYHSTVIQVKQIENKIQDFFNLLATRENPRFDLCSDYGERAIQILIPFDEINMGFLNEDKIKEITDLVSKHRDLRKNQKKLESEVNEFRTVEDNIKTNIGIL